MRSSLTHGDAVAAASAGRRARAVLAGALTVALVTSCGAGGGDDAAGSAAAAGSGTGPITVWAHQGQAGEVSALQSAVEEFNRQDTGVTVTLTLVPEADYPRTIAATNADDLPDVLEFDGPTLSSLVYNGKLSPIGDFVSDGTTDNALASILAQGTATDDKLYGLGMFDSGLGLWGNKALLDSAGVRYPTSPEQAWTAEDFTAALRTLAGADADGKVIDLQENVGFDAEWGTYGFSPVVQSAGAQLIEDGKATGVLDSPEAVRALTTVAGWREFTDPNTDSQAFTGGRTALSWVGHWLYQDYAAALGDDLVLLPLPDFGQGAKTGQGSWAWGIGSKSENGQAAGKFLDHLLSDSSVLAMTEANGAPPGTKTALAASTLYRQGGPLSLYAEQLTKACAPDESLKADCFAVPRPLTAGYPTITQQFAKAFSAIYRGADPQAELTAAARAIDVDFADNDGYQLS